MSTMISLRLYRRHDLDLVSLQHNPEISLQKIMKQALLAQANGLNANIVLPPCCQKYSDVPSTSHLKIYLSDKNPDDITIKKYVEQIPSGYKNSYIKTLTRYHIHIPSHFKFNNGTLEMITPVGKDDSNGLYT